MQNHPDAISFVLNGGYAYLVFNIAPDQLTQLPNVHYDFRDTPLSSPDTGKQIYDIFEDVQGPSSTNLWFAFLAKKALIRQQKKQNREQLKGDIEVSVMITLAAPVVVAAVPTVMTVGGIVLIADTLL
eukprot:TRINITY_DN15257_c0_g2_i7.p1 TRINITY_DN15257_c0_g2~~TRINITY_DN15257_c0_g2_i7.p1  ORF type:complete len:128 (-),score=31.01 TRINITY_DN15257_c0_g2_i7:80-463(-)